MTSNAPPGGPKSRREVTGDLSSDSTLDILARAQRGDGPAAQALVERVAPSIRRWARGRAPQYVRHDANTEDIVQDALLQALKNVEHVRHRTVGGLQAYLRTSVVNRIRDLIRGAKRHGTQVELEEALHDETPSPLEQAILREGLENFLAALQRLKPSDRQVIIWRVELGYRIDEIAAKLGKSQAAAGMSVSRALARLAKELRLDGHD